MSNYVVVCTTLHTIPKIFTGAGPRQPIQDDDLITTISSKPTVTREQVLANRVAQQNLLDSLGTKIPARGGAGSAVE